MTIRDGPSQLNHNPQETRKAVSYMSEYKLRKAGVAVTLNETKGRRFMIMQKAQTAQASLAERIGFMKKVLENGT